MNYLGAIRERILVPDVVAHAVEKALDSGDPFALPEFLHRPDIALGSNPGSVCLAGAGLGLQIR